VIISTNLLSFCHFRLLFYHCIMPSFRQLLIIIILLLASQNLLSHGKEAKYSCLSQSFLCVPIALETPGAIAPSSLDFLSEVGRQLIAATGDAIETAFLFQRISVALQRFSAVLTRVFCRTRRRAGPLAIPSCVSSFCFCPLAFYTTGHKLIIMMITIFQKTVEEHR